MIWLSCPLFSHLVIYVIYVIYFLIRVKFGGHVPYPTSVICAHGLTLTSIRRPFGEILWDNSNNASDIIIGFYFVGTVLIVMMHSQCSLDWDRDFVKPLGSVNPA